MEILRCTAGIAMFGGVVLGAAVGLAGPASAEVVPGAYTATMIDPGATGKVAGDTTVWNLTPCGPDCTHVGTSGPGWDLHRNGNIWSGSNADGTQTLDNDSLILTLQYNNKPNVVIGLVRNG